MSKCLIISRFNEDISWVKDYKDFKIYIYNKGEDIKDKDFKNIIKLDNIGRESHTWLYHIVNNYNKLADINIFMQGRIDDLNCMAYETPNEYLKHINEYGFAASRYGILGPLHWEWNVGIERNVKYKKAWENLEISRSDIGFRQFSKNLIPNIPIIVATSYGGCFAIKKELIWQYKYSFYSNLLRKLSHHKNPIEGHFMERLWCYLFTQNRPLLRAFRDVIHTKIERSKLSYILNKLIS